MANVPMNLEKALSSATLLAAVLFALYLSKASVHSAAKFAKASPPAIAAIPGTTELGR